MSKLKNKTSNLTEEIYAPFSIMRPGGNDTCLVEGLYRESEIRQRINKEIQDVYSNVEQVGFISSSNETPELLMAGGEFCGNATRSAAWELLKGVKGEELHMISSGVESGKKLNAGIDFEGQGWAEMPIYNNFESVQKLSHNMYLVKMSGITHIIYYNDSIDEENINQELLKAQTLDILKKYNLLNEPAAGVMYTKSIDNKFLIFPVVRVRDINTLFYETGCGSGTTALGLVEVRKQKKEVQGLEVIQPSGMHIKVDVDANNKEFIGAKIYGPVQKIKTGTYIENGRINYILEKLESIKDIENNNNDGLINLYKDIFSAPPYYESFESDYVKDLFKSYITNGHVILAKTKNKVIGFSAVVPISENLEVMNAVSNHIDCSNAWYMSDLGVAPQYRRNLIAKKMVLERIKYVPRGSIIIMRTSVDNIASQSIYRSLGFNDLKEVYQDVESKRTDGSVKTDRRIFLYKINK